jgi:hypothetical protein
MALFLAEEPKISIYIVKRMVFDNTIGCLIFRKSIVKMELQNKTYTLAPDTIYSPYDVDGEIHRHDMREGGEGVPLYLDLGLIDVETCKPLSNAWLTI